MAARGIGYGKGGARDLVLAAMALWPWYVVGRISQPAVLAGTYMIAGIFVARGIAGFSHRWRAHFTIEPFATRNRLSQRHRQGSASSAAM